jgi:hypothetical protein
VATGALLRPVPAMFVVSAAAFLLLIVGEPAVIVLAALAVPPGRSA